MKFVVKALILVTSGGYFTKPSQLVVLGNYQ